MTAPSLIEQACMSRLGVVWNGTEYEEEKVNMTNDETCALIAEAREEESIQDKLGDGFSEGSGQRAFYYEHRDRYGRLADALEAATRERAAALAVTEQVRDAWRKDHREMLAQLDKVTAERDAAVAAIERVRAVLSKWERMQERNRKYLTYGNLATVAPIDCTGDLSAALDGAPEPEDAWEYGLLNPQAPDGGKLRDGAHLISDNREHILKQQQRGHPSIQAVCRRKAGPWLPVEGESNGV